MLFNGAKRVNVTGEPIRTSLGRGDLDPADAGARYYNAGAFAFPGDFEFGNGAHYFAELRRTPVFQENLSIQKQIRLFEHADQTVRLTLRADMFNLFNRTNFTVNSAIGNANFGRATAPQNGPRIITMGARIEF